MCTTKDGHEKRGPVSDVRQNTVALKEKKLTQLYTSEELTDKIHP